MRRKTHNHSGSCPDRRGGGGPELSRQGATSCRRSAQRPSENRYSAHLVDLREMHADRTTREHAIGECRALRCASARYGSNTKRVRSGSPYDHCLHDLVCETRRRARRESRDRQQPRHFSSRSRGYGVPFSVPVRPDTKAEQEEHARAFDQQRIGLVVMARYMQIVTPEFVAYASGR